MERFLQCRSCLLYRQIKQWNSIYVRFPHNWRQKRTHYEILGIPPKATTKEIRDAFVEQSKLNHPDSNPEDPESHDNFVRVSEAYATLSKTSSRREYDFTLQHLRGYPGMYKPQAGYYPSREDMEFRYPNRQRYYTDGTFYDKTKADPSHTKDNYYGFKGIPKQTNSMILGVCMAVMGTGFLMFLVVFRYSVNKRRAYEAELWRENKRLFIKEKDIQPIASDSEDKEELPNDRYMAYPSTRIGHHLIRSTPTMTYDPEYLEKVMKLREERLKESIPVHEQDS